jgi:hypothetical protein
VLLENMGNGDIAVGGENFKFVQFFAAGDYCATRTLQTHPSPKCPSSVAGTSPNAKGAALLVGVGNVKTFKIECSMTLITAVCKAMTHMCIDFVAVAGGASYIDKDPTNNCKCTNLITTACKPSKLYIYIFHFE